MAVEDIYFTYFLGGLISLAALAYGVRLATRGVARSERVARIGGTALVHQEVMDWWYWSIDPIVRALVALGVTANGLTWSALMFGTGAGVALGFGWFGLATLLATASVICDILDGQVARITGSGSNRGELLDAAIDRYTEFAFLAGLAFYCAATPWQLALVLAALLASFMISYTSAKAEAMQVAVPRGLMRRHERATYLISGTGFTSLLGGVFEQRGLPAATPVLAGLAIVAVFGNAAAVTRLVRIARALK